MKRKIVAIGLFLFLLIGGMNVHAQTCEVKSGIGACESGEENFEIFSEKDIKKVKVGVSIAVVIAGFILYKYHKNK
jgi:predicted cation transporter